jgi:hypothetical protein
MARPMARLKTGIRYQDTGIRTKGRTPSEAESLRREKAGQKILDDGYSLTTNK